MNQIAEKDAKIIEIQTSNGVNSVGTSKEVTYMYSLVISDHIRDNMSIIYLDIFISNI